jgi:hypothetical protein
LLSNFDAEWRRFPFPAIGNQFGSVFGTGTKVGYCKMHFRAELEVWKGIVDSGIESIHLLRGSEIPTTGTLSTLRMPGCSIRHIEAILEFNYSVGEETLKEVR